MMDGEVDPDRNCYRLIVVRGDASVPHVKGRV